MSRIHWIRVLVGGVLAEFLVFAIVFPTLSFFGQTAFLTSILIASAVAPFVLALWVCRRVHSDFVVHGALVGGVAIFVYLIVSRGQPEPLLYKISHGLKILGGLTGGIVASRRSLSPR